MKFKPSFCSIAVLAIAGLFSSCGGGNNNNSQSGNAIPATQLNGSFAFSANGSDPADGNYFVAGSFTADGKGGLTGIEDLNLGSGVDSNVPYTGMYQVDSAGAVSATISDGTGIPTFFTFAIP